MSSFWRITLTYIKLRDTRIYYIIVLIGNKIKCFNTNYITFMSYVVHILIGNHATKLCDSIHFSHCLTIFWIETVCPYRTCACTYWCRWALRFFFFSFAHITRACPPWPRYATARISGCLRANPRIDLQ